MLEINTNKFMKAQSDVFRCFVKLKVQNTKIVNKPQDKRQ